MALIHGDCLDVMAGMDPESVDAIATDPPYGIRFMGKAWDGADIEDLARKQASKRPRPDGRKGDLSLASAAGTYDRSPSANRAFQTWCELWAREAFRVAKPSAYLLAFGGTRTVHRMTVAIEDAGWIIRDMLVWAYASGFPKSKASLKPAWEPIVMARKPGPLRMLAIDECRIGTGAMGWDTPMGGIWSTDTAATGQLVEKGGRWPANVILTDPIFDGGWEGVVGGGTSESGIAVERNGGGGKIFGSDRRMPPRDDFGYGDSGTYSRFFLIPKADRTERVLSDGRRSPHPTQKPVDLMRHLIRLVTPTGGILLDPFLGSGTTAMAAEAEGFQWIGIERDREYVDWATDRLNDGTQRGLGLGA